MDMGIKPDRITDLLADNTAKLAKLREGFGELESILSRGLAMLPEAMTGNLAQLRKDLAAFSTPITFVGQVKSGKTALVNALSNHPGLLPSDVNPWTSVVTTLHINVPHSPKVRAEFTFFDRDEWKDLIQEGGRLGTLAKRAGAEQELADIRAQVEEMQAKSRERLGRNFELLLGNRHKYDQFSKELIERYVCLGDHEDDPSLATAQGRFADITRSADLYLDVPAYPMALSLQDTPGVNDPFLIREQITLRNITHASLCVVVLSAAQAMNTVDLALLQLLCALESRRVIIFVNRIDELQDPAREIPEIRKALQNILAERGIGDMHNILFGSARWGEIALSGDLDRLTPASAAAARNLHAATTKIPDSPLSVKDLWRISGLGGLIERIGVAIHDTSAQRLLDDVARQTANIFGTAHTQLATAITAGNLRLNEVQCSHKLANLRSAMDRYVVEDMEAMFEVLTGRIERAAQEYIEQTARSMIEKTLERGTGATETCDPMQLRLRLKNAYLRFSNDLRVLFDNVANGTAHALSDLFEQMLGEGAAGLSFEAPAAPPAAPPVALGRTIVVDFEATRWRTWMQTKFNRGGLEREYRRLVEAEVATIARELIEAARNDLTSMAGLLHGFLDEQGAIAMAIASGKPHGQTTAAMAQRAAELHVLQEALTKCRQTLEPTPVTATSAPLMAPSLTAGLTSARPAAAVVPAQVTGEKMSAEIIPLVQRYAV